jgi:hypothetical protein
VPVRDHLTAGQRTMIVAKIYPDPQKLKRKGSSVAEQLGFGKGKLSEARLVLKVMPELADAGLQRLYVSDHHAMLPRQLQRACTRNVELAFPQLDHAGAPARAVLFVNVAQVHQFVRQPSWLAVALIDQHAMLQGLCSRAAYGLSLAQNADFRHARKVRLKARRVSAPQFCGVVLRLGGTQ